jgi:sporulation protein YlmC with PRC-barrel domain
MLVLKDRIINVPIVSIQTGSQVARTEQPIIDPRELKIVGFYCDGPTLDSKPAVLLMNDIRESGPLGYIINSSDNLVPPKDLVRLQGILSYNFSLENKLVVEENGRKVGKVVDYTLDNASFYIVQLHVQPNFWQAWSTAEVLIGRTQIIEVTDTKIVVASATIKDKPPVKATVTHVVENPFRRTQPQAEASRSTQEQS